MGTRSNTVVKKSNQRICCMYRHMDGYPTGHGKDLVDFLKDMEIVNGISLADSDHKIANGMGCLAAQIVDHFKEGIGGIYLVPPVGSLTGEHDYCYTIGDPPKEIVGPGDIRPYTGSADNLLFSVHKWGKVVFNGTVGEFRQALADGKFN